MLDDIKKPLWATADKLRANMDEADVVEVMIALPGQLFFNTQIPACLWFLAKQKKRKGEVLFIDARKLASMISRVQGELTDEVIARIAATVAAWRGAARRWMQTPKLIAAHAMNTWIFRVFAVQLRWPRSPSTAMC